MPWTASSPYGAPPAYSGTWSLGPRPPSHVYTASPTYGTPAPAPIYPTPPYTYAAPPAPPYLSAPAAPPVAPPATAPTMPPSWDQAAFITDMNNFTLNNQGTDWIFDSGASSHMSSNLNLLSSCSPSQFSSIIVGNGSSIPITCNGHSYISNPNQNFYFAIFLLLRP